MSFGPDTVTVVALTVALEAGILAPSDQGGKPAWWPEFERQLADWVDPPAEVALTA
jgi:hypothetical protein